MAIFAEQSTQSIERIRELTAAGSCDLHLHTNCSDGSDSPAVLVARVIAAGLKAFSITDHDTLSAIKPAQAALEVCTVQKRGSPIPLLVPGVELSVEDDDQELHVLGYFPYGGEYALKSFLKEQRLFREMRNRTMIDRLAELGYPILPKYFQESGKEVLGRMQVALLLIRDGYFESVDDAFDQLLGDGRPGYIERSRPSFSEGIQAIRTAGGAAVLAHPALYGWIRETPFIKPELIRRLQRYQQLGLQGVEAYHGEASPDEQAQVEAAAMISGLVATCGSDDHGKHKKHAHLYRKGSHFGDRESIVVTAALITGPTAAGASGLLLTRRSGRRSDAGKWEFPGGKLEPDETAEECLIRELREELGVQSRIGTLSIAVHHDYSALRVVLLCFEATLLDTPAINPDIHDQISYYTLEEARKLDLLAADVFVLDELDRMQTIPLLPRAAL